MPPLGVPVKLTPVLDLEAMVKGITVLVNIHVLSLARKYAKRVIAFRKGHLVFDGPMSSLSEEELEKIYHLDENNTGSNA